jgi:hypothetical protein
LWRCDKKKGEVVWAKGQNHGEAIRYMEETMEGKDYFIRVSFQTHLGMDFPSSS